MVYRHALLAALLWTSPLLAEDSAESDLTRARAALERGAVDEAATIYGGIKLGTPQWLERVVDVWRWHFLKERYNEAWQVQELAARIGLRLDHSDYATLLSLLKAKVCILNLSAQDQLATALAYAHVYRFSSRFRATDYSESVFQRADEGGIPNHLGPSQHHHLADILGAKLIAHRGCSDMEGSLADRQTASTNELRELRRWYRNPKHREHLGYEAVELRLLQLAVKAKMNALAKQILAPYQILDAAGWLKIPDPERRFLWSLLVQEEMVGAPPYKPSDKEAALVEALVLGINTPDSAEWFGLLDNAAIPPMKRVAMEAHLLSIPDIPHRPYLLLRQAEAYAMKNEVPQALAVLRRLLVQDEGEGEEEVIAGASVLAGDIFAEFGYDEAILGAIQNTVPTSQWGRIFRRQLMLDALVGHAKGFDILRRMTKSPKHKGSLGLTDQESELLAALAHRHAQAFTKALHQLERGGNLGGQSLRFLADLGANVLQLDTEQRRGVQSYLSTISEALKSYARLHPYNKSVSELARLMGGAAADDYSQGSETVRAGTVTMGVVNLAAKQLIASPFEWTPVTSLPLRDLLLIPSKPTSRDWVIR